MVLPSRIKSSLPEASESRIVLTRGFEPCITIYPLEEWQKIFERVASLDEFNPEYRRFQRNFLRGNTEVELDKSGRFLLPRTMARYAQLDREAILIGMGNRIEVWNPDLYEEYLINDQEEFSSLAQQFLSKGKTSADKARGEEKAEAKKEEAEVEEKVVLETKEVEGQEEEKAKVEPKQESKEERIEEKGKKAEGEDSKEE